MKATTLSTEASLPTRPLPTVKRCMSIFGSRGFYAFDLEGNLKWKKDLGKLQMRLAFGEGIAPIIHGNYLVIQNDHEGESYIVVLDKRDGKEIWRAGREERSSWPQPIVVEHKGRNQLVTSSTRVRSYDLETARIDLGSRRPRRQCHPGRRQRQR